MKFTGVLMIFIHLQIQNVCGFIFVNCEFCLVGICVCMAFSWLFHLCGFGFPKPKTSGAASSLNIYAWSLWVYNVLKMYCFYRFMQRSSARFRLQFQNSCISPCFWVFYGQNTLYETLRFMHLGSSIWIYPIRKSKFTSFAIYNSIFVDSLCVSEL